MARSTAAPAATETTQDGGGSGGHTRGRALVALPLALWRLRRMWRLLLVAQLGLIAAVLLVSAVPLLTLVAADSGFQGLLASRPAATTLFAHAGSNDLSPQTIGTYEQRLHVMTTRYLAAFHPGVPEFELISQPVELGGAAAGDIGIYGEPADVNQRDLRLISGRLPRPASGVLEIAVTPTTATMLDLTLGATPTLATRSGAPPLRLLVVGIVTRSATTPGPDYEPQLQGGPNGNTTEYAAVASRDALLSYPYDWSALQQAQQVAGPGLPDGFPVWNLSWTYTLDVSHLSAADLNTLLATNPQHFNQLLIQVMQGTTPSPDQGIAPNQEFAFSEIFDVLYDYQHRLIGAQVIAGILLADVLGLMLIFIAQMTGVLVERQEPLIALLRSRGASRRQISSAFALQSLLLGIVGLAVGALLAIPVARGIASLLLPASQRGALSALDGPIAALATSGWIVAVFTALVFVLAMIRATGRAAALNALTASQEAARPRRKPLWQRLYLDVLAALLALLGYGAYALMSYLAGAQTPTPGSANVRVLLSPLALIAPIFLMVAAALLFLRIFPLLLRLGERLARRGRGVALPLALAQLARATHQTTRMVLPLALATSIALFTVAAQATLAQNIRDAAAFQAGADFSGGLAQVPAATPAAVADRTAAYDAIPGVRSAALGYRVAAPTQDCPGSAPYCTGAPVVTIQIAAVQSERFAQTAIWPAADAAQPLGPLMAQFAARRGDAAARATVPAILDADAAWILGAHAGSTFILPVPGYTGGSMRFVTLAVVPFLPGDYSDRGGGLLADYLTYTTVFAHHSGASGSAGASSAAAAPSLAPNFVWLRTAGDPAALASVRAALASGPLALNELAQNLDLNPFQLPVSDRRATAANLQSDPLPVDIGAILALGAAATLALALCGALIAAWSAARSRQVPLALLRALGCEPRRTRAVLRWEQGIAYAVAIALGAALGAALIVVMLPILPELALSNDFLGGPVERGGPPPRVIWPWPALLGLLAALVVIGIVAITLAARQGARPSLARILRLSGE